MSTLSPPFTLLTIVPSTAPSRSKAFSISRQTLNCSAFCRERTISPVSVSLASK